MSVHSPSDQIAKAGARVHDPLRPGPNGGEAEAAIENLSCYLLLQGLSLLLDATIRQRY